MDPYVGNPANDPVTVQLPDDIADEWTASVINTPTETLADSIAYARSRLNQCSTGWHAVAAWSDTLVGGGSLTLSLPPIWDTANGRWIASFVDASPNQHNLQSFDGRTWIDFFSPTVTGGTAVCWGLVARPTDGAVIALQLLTPTGVPTPSTDVITASGATLHTSQPWTNPGAGHWYSGGWVNSLWVVWKGGSTAAPMSSPDANTWTNALTWAPPGGFTVHDRAHVIAQQGGTTLALLFPSGTSVVSKFMSTLDGQNWFQFAMPTFTLSGEQVIDAAYDAFTNTIYLLTGNTTATHLWSSTTLGTWTLASTLAYQCFAIRANGRELLVWRILAGQGPALGNAYRGIVSTNGGATWSRPVPVGTGAAPGNYFALRVSDGQFMYCNTSEFAASSIVVAPPVGVV